MFSPKSTSWRFIDDQGSFELKNPQYNSYLYFPLVNQAGMMSSITPTLNGDAKLNQNTFLLLPVSVEDLHNCRSARNFWVRINGEPWSVTGNSAEQITKVGLEQDEAVNLQAGFLWHSIKRSHDSTGLTATVVNFVPANQDTLELMKVNLSNQGRETIELDPVAAIPIYARSADNLRDHRHVTALLHRTHCHPYGVWVRPTMSFDERGHKENRMIYAVLGVDGDGNPPQGFTPLVEDFIGEGGCLEWPRAIVEGTPILRKAGSYFEGYESIGALHFSRVSLEPGESKTYILILGIMTDEMDIRTLVEQYGSEEKFSESLDVTRAFWQDKLSSLRFNHQNQRLDGWLQWVTLQPFLRRIMGNSFLPYHDYGRGGRGWRDLWQDLLAIMLTERTAIETELLGNFAGVRMDGSNATIIGSEPGEFKADRNSIPRVWMDHGAWPLITTKLYLDLTGNIRLLLEEQTYFKDHFSHRCQQVNRHSKSEQGITLRAVSGDLVEGTVLEHLLVQHLTAFYNVGEHNLIKLEGGDWNDGLDMAAERGESVSFSAMYAGNLQTLSDLCLVLVDAGIEETPIAVELLSLLDRVSDSVDYCSVESKQNRLQDYFDNVKEVLSGEQISVPLKAISIDLHEKAVWLADLIRQQEWISDQHDRGCFNGYYDNQGQRVEGEHPQGFRMTLTGQVFPLMTGIASSTQAKQILRAAEHYLYEENLNGHRLNTNFGTDLPKLGRAFSFAFGQKENGAVFSHMSVMFAYALYQQGLAEEAWRVLDGLYQQSQDFEKSHIYPGIPEYFSPRGRGMYPYLTGSSAWYMFTLLTEAYGVKGQMGDLCLEPKLAANQFSQADQLSVQTSFANKNLEVVYNNPKRLSYGKYCISRILVNGRERTIPSGAKSIRIPRTEVLGWSEPVRILIDLISI